MEISVELTLTPLQDSFEEPIKAFIKKLRTSGLQIVENAMSTQVYGSYDKVMEVLQEEAKYALEAVDNGVLLIKIVKGNRSGYAADF